MMKLSRRRGPYWRYGDTGRAQRLDVLLCCGLLLIPQALRFGMRPVLMTLACAGIGIAAEMLCCLLYRVEAAVTDLDSATIGVLIAMLVPANVGLYVPALAVIFAVAIAKMPFGGTGRAPLHPVAAGMAFATLCFPVNMFAYAAMDAGVLDLDLLHSVQVKTVQSPAALLNSGARPTLLLTELLTGEVEGPIGTTVAVVTAAMALYLIVRRTISYRIPLCWVLAVAITAALWPRVTTGRLDSALVELLTGSLLFYGIFLAAHTTTAPKLPIAQCAYGFVGGLIAMLFRYQGVFEQGGCFAVLLLNAMAPIFDKAAWHYLYKKRGGAPQ
ncbi:MAG: RnfABCDGE type electron transport complex subunit D [Clostridia bacterium]|nr:RnfABCDGE type electron transport complex subunit D [Clostridia bacterium]